MSRRSVIGSEVRHAAQRLEGHALALGLVIAAVGAVVVFVAAISVNGVPFQNRYAFGVELPGATPPLRAGAQVRVAGKIAGVVTAVEPGERTLHLEANLDPEFAPLGRGARVHVAVLLGTSLTYLVVDLGDQRAPLPEGTTIPSSRVTLSSSLPQALETFDRATRASLARNFTVLGAGYAGHGEATNRAIADQRVAFSQSLPLLRATVPRRGIVRGAIDDAAVVSGAVRGQRADDNGAGTAAARQVVETLATHREAGGRLTDRLASVEQHMSATLPRTERAIAATTQMVRALTPGARALNASLPEFVALFSTSEDLRDSTRRFNRYAQPVLRRLGPILRVLLGPARALPALLTDAAEMGDIAGPYAPEWVKLGTNLAKTTHYKYLGSQPAVRVSGAITCVAARNAYPAPGQAPKDRKACR
jgi:phospholipid/cholesterol/gamma-HCH transport system substrate-binding protein